MFTISVFTFNLLSQKLLGNSQQLPLIIDVFPIQVHNKLVTDSLLFTSLPC